MFGLMKARTCSLDDEAKELRRLRYCGTCKILGSLYGSAQIAYDFPRLVRLAETGQLDLGAMVSRTITLDQINDSFRAMQAGEVIRSVVSYS